MISTPLYNLLTSLEALPFLRLKEDQRIFVRRLFYWAILYIIVHVVIALGELYYIVGSILLLPQYLKVLIAALNVAMLYILISSIIAYLLPKRQYIFLLLALAYSFIAPLSIFLRLGIIAVLVYLIIKYRSSYPGILYLAISITLTVLSTVLFAVHDAILKLLSIILVFVSMILCYIASEQIMIKKIFFPSPIPITMYHFNRIYIGKVEGKPASLEEFLRATKGVFGKLFCLINVRVNEEGTDILYRYGNLSLLNHVDEYIIRAVISFAELGSVVVHFKKYYIGAVIEEKTNFSRKGFIVISTSEGITDGLTKIIKEYLKR